MNDNERQFEDFIRQTKFDDAPDPNQRDRLEQDLLAALAKQTTRRIKVWRIIMKSLVTKLAAAAVILIAVFIGMEIFGINNSSIAWGDISKHFESVPFFNLTTYIREDDSSEIRKIQIWKSEDSRVRGQAENGITFVDLKDGKIKLTTFDQHSESKLEAVDISIRQSAKDPNISLTAILWDTLCTKGQFSLDTLIKSFPSNVSGITPVEAADTVASKEIIVFEAKSQTTPQYLTIWALRESKLPLLMQFRDPRSGEYGDFIFNYSHKMEPSFFDPEAFKKQ